MWHQTSINSATPSRYWRGHLIMRFHKILHINRRNDTQCPGIMIHTLNVVAVKMEFTSRIFDGCPNRLSLMNMDAWTQIGLNLDIYLGYDSFCYLKIYDSEWVEAIFDAIDVLHLKLEVLVGHTGRLAAVFAVSTSDSRCLAFSHQNTMILRKGTKRIGYGRRNCSLFFESTKRRLPWFLIAVESWTSYQAAFSMFEKTSFIFVYPPIESSLILIKLFLIFFFVSFLISANSSPGFLISLQPKIESLQIV